MSDPSDHPYPPISEYALIGDGRSAALVGREGSIDWCCLPRFDSPAVFGRILDWRRGGFAELRAVGSRASVSRRYAADTNVLITTWRTDDGEVRVTDFMPVGGASPSRKPAICRLVEGISGRVGLTLRVQPGFGFGSASAEFTPLSPTRIAMEGAGQRIVCEASIALRDVGAAIVGDCTVSEGDREFVAFCDDPGAEEANLGSIQELLHATCAYWKEWVDSLHYVGLYRERVVRSALVLKSLVYEANGAVIAAPTTSLPERRGGALNWDYRFVWLRDAALLLDVLQRLHRHEESVRFFDWLKSIGATHRLQPVYSIDSDADVSEHEATWLEGYRGSRPVRIGNAAAQQLQLDAPGHLLDAVDVCYERMPREMQPEFWDFLCTVADRVVRSWRLPDQSIWEIRGERKQFLYSKVFAWVALDRACRMSEMYRLPAPLERWREAREEIRRYILDKGFNPQIQAFSAVVGEDAVDPAALVIPLVGFLPADDPRMKSTVRRIREELEDHGLLHRNPRMATGQPEAAFLVCTFWLADYLTLVGERDEAKRIFERIVSCANDVGLLAEEVDPKSGALLGNFPQGLTHLELIRSAMRISEAFATANSDSQSAALK